MDIKEFAFKVTDADLFSLMAIFFTVEERLRQHQTIIKKT